MTAQEPCEATGCVAGFVEVARVVVNQGEGWAGSFGVVSNYPCAVCLGKGWVQVST